MPIVPLPGVGAIDYWAGVVASYKEKVAKLNALAARIEKEKVNFHTIEGIVKDLDLKARLATDPAKKAALVKLADANYDDLRAQSRLIVSLAAEYQELYLDAMSTAASFVSIIPAAELWRVAPPPPSSVPVPSEYYAPSGILPPNYI